MNPIKFKPIHIYFICTIFAFCYSLNAQDSLRVRTKGKGTTSNEALINAKISALMKAGWVEFTEFKSEAILSSKIVDTKILADSSYQVILDSWVKTNYTSTTVGVGIFSVIAGVLVIGMLFLAGKPW